MIFGTVGTHTVGFERLIVALDNYAALIEEEVIVQIGASAFEPQHATWFRMAHAERIAELMAAARVIVTHAGAGSLLQALDQRARVVTVPRLRRYGEVLDDHQLELCEALASQGEVVVVTEVAELGAKLGETTSRHRQGHNPLLLQIVEALRSDCHSLVSWRCR